jgi:hypothetical protein
MDSSMPGGGAMEIEFDVVAEPEARMTEECLELTAGSPTEVMMLRSWIRRVNGSSNPQPFLVEDPPGQFRLYVGEAAERARTRTGVQ